MGLTDNWWINTQTTSDHTHGMQWAPTPLQVAPVVIYHGVAQDYDRTFREYVAEREQRESMRGLFEVFIVDPETGLVRTPKLFVAKDAESAKVKALRQESDIEDAGDYDIVVRRLGDVRPKCTVQEVKVIK